MANTVVTYQGNGAIKQFVITFDYLSRKFVSVDIDGVPQTNGVEYSFLDARTIGFVNAPAAGTFVTIRRNTSATERIVEFRDASVLKASDLDLSSLQTFHIAEEAKDLVLDTLGTNEDGDLDARSRKIVNLKDGVNPNDAINYGQYTEDREGTYQAALAAKASEDNAKASEVVAEASKVAAKASEDNAKASEVAAKASEVAAKASEDNAKASEVNAKASEVNAKTSEDNAKASEVTASASAATASAAAMDAQQSESDTLALKNQTQQIVDTANGTIGQIAEINAMVNEVKGARIPVGAIVSFPVKGNYPGYLYLDGSAFDKAVYKQLAVLYSSGVLPDLRGASLTGVDDGKGRFTDKTPKTFLPSQNISHTHTGSATLGGAHGHTGSAAAGGSHGHSVSDPGHSHGIYKSGGAYNLGDAASITSNASNRTAVAGVTVSAGTGISIAAGGEHSHEVTIAEGGAHTHAVTVNSSGGNESRPFSYTVYWYIKAADTVGQPEVIQAQDLVNRVAALENTVSTSVSALQTNIDAVNTRVDNTNVNVAAVQTTADAANSLATQANNKVIQVVNTSYSNVTGSRSKGQIYTSGPNGRHVIIQWNVSGAHTAYVYIGSVVYNVSNNGSSSPIITQFWVPANTVYAVDSSTLPAPSAWLETN